ncbi:hypothetical protein N0V93_007879 [Gnomoniopsis smithogilvyi]|uniref:Protein kinase domain-containing protein n=1 Tax=Gnomoniopsis smithogilvyi TaxID=1191159 RepID=A0A9W8YKN9_9PEZI|nr:hypothetical protein N0V93_007879 [Gnomoniopsis smithogilvyi]
MAKKAELCGQLPPTDVPLKVLRQILFQRHNHGDPVLKWYEIQEQISHSDTDILLLLDCCYAAQAARDRQHGKGGLEVLAAAAMGVKTRGAGIKSFTSILLREMRLAVEKDGFVSPKDLHGQLCNRKQDLVATPVHISLKPGRHPLRLMPLRGHAPKLGKDSEAINSSFLHLLVEIKENMTLDSAGKINEWLREDIPDFVSSLDVFDKTEHIQRAVKDLDRGQKEFTKHIDMASRDEINQAWATVLTLVRNYEQSNLSMVEGGLMNDAAKKRRALEFLSQLDTQGEGVITALENGILAAFKTEHNDVLTETTEDANIQALGIDYQLRIRRMIVQSEVPQNTEDHATVEGQTFHLCTTGSLIMQEVRPYDSYMSAADLPALQYRLGLLAKLLSTPKSREFRSLQCTKWSHQESAHTYTLDFEVPSTYTRCQYMDLNMSIHNAKGKHRPTLNERVRMALTIAKAIRKWHLVGWVHQGISSHNIIFFFRESCSIERPDYSEPFLKGFEFSRPDSDPSIGRAVDDLELNVYRHPNRQGVARKGHQKKYDIYSLGVVLLEIARQGNVAD